MGRRLVAGGVAVLAVAAGGAACVAAAQSQAGARGPVAFVLSIDSRTVTPVDLRTGTALPAIRVGRSPEAIVATPDGKTAYVANSGSGTVTPIDVATLRAGPPVRVCQYPVTMAAAPDGKTVYVACDSYSSGMVVPVSTAGNTAGAPILVGHYPVAIAVTPDGRDVIVANSPTAYRNEVHVISTATGTVVRRFVITEGPNSLTVAPGGGLAYVPGAGRARSFQLPIPGEQWFGIVTPIRLGTFTAGRPIVVGHDPNEGNESPDSVAFSPDGKTAWVAYPATNRVIPVSTATGRPGKPIRTLRIGSHSDIGDFPMECVVTADGKWVYVSAGVGVDAIRASTRQVTRIRAGPGSIDPMYDGATIIAVSPDGKTVYVLGYHGSHPGTLTPIRVATSKPGKPIRVGVNPISMVIVP